MKVAFAIKHKLSLEIWEKFIKFIADSELSCRIFRNVEINLNLEYYLVHMKYVFESFSKSGKLKILKLEKKK
jgi:hypothetical protein